MPLPSYLLEQPQLDATDAVGRRIQRLGVDAVIERRGTTLTLRRLDPFAASGEAIAKAIRILCEHADAARFSIEVKVPEIFSSLVSILTPRGFRIAALAGDDDEAGAHYLLRRSATV